MKKMKKVIVLLLMLMAITNGIEAQNVAINGTGAAPAASAMLDISAADKGLLIPRVALTSTADVTTIPSPTLSLLVYNTNTSMTGGGEGFYYFDGSAWRGLGGGKELIWHSSLSNAGGTQLFAGAQTAYPNSPTNVYSAANEALSQVKMPKCLITRMRVFINNNGLNSASTFTLRKNGVSQALSITVPATTTGFFELTGAVPFNDGDLLSVQAVFGGTGGQPIGIARIEFSYY